VLADYIGPVIRIPTASSPGGPAMIQERLKPLCPEAQYQVLAERWGSTASSSGADAAPGSNRAENLHSVILTI